MTTLATVLVALERRIPGVANRNRMVDAVNTALSEVGKVTKVDTTLTVVANQTEYSLPSGVQDVARVQVANDSDSDYYLTMFNWREIDGALHFTKEIDASAGVTIRLYYNNIHDSVTEDADTIEDEIPIELLTPVAAYYYYRLQFETRANVSVKEDSVLQLLMQEKNEAKARYRIRTMVRDPILGSD